MKHIYIKIFALLSILALGSTQADFTFDPTAGTTEIFNPANAIQHTQLFSWFHAFDTPPGKFSVNKFDLTTLAATPTQATVTDAAFVIKAVSKSHTCAIVYDSVAVPKILKLIKFTATTAVAEATFLLGNANSADDRLVQADVNGVANSAFAVADDCMAVRVGLKVLHRTTAAGVFTADAPLVAGAVAPVFNSDFTFFVAADGIYKYNTVPATKIYEKITTVPASPTFLLNKKIWTQANKIVVFHWAAGTAPAINYQLQVYSGATYTQAVTVTGVSHTTAPAISLSSTLQTIVLSGKTTAAQSVPFYTGKIINYVAHTSADIVFAAPLITATESYITVTDKFLYARNKVPNTAIPPLQQHAGYYIVNTGLVQYEKTTLTAPQITNWQRTLILSNDPGSYINLYHQYKTASVITLYRQILMPPTQLFEWDRTIASAGTNALNGAAYLIEESRNSFTWFQQAAANSNKQFTYMEFKQDLSTVKVTLQPGVNFVLKATSQNKKCAVLYNPLPSASQILRVYNFNVAHGAAPIVFAANILASTTAALAAASTFSISDDCNFLRIGAKHYYWAATVYTEITDLPTGTAAITNPVATGDFSFIVGNAGIYRYVPAVVNPAVPAKIVLNRNDTFFDKKQVWKVGNNMVIHSYKQTATAGVFDVKLQINTLFGSTFRNLYEIVAQSTGIPTLLISPTLSKVVSYGLSNTSSPFYFALSIDYANRVVKEMVIPADVKAAVNDVAVSDSFLYFRNKAGTSITHWGFIIMGSTLIQQFTGTVPYSTFDGYSRALLIPDDGKLSVATQLREGTDGKWFRIVKDQRTSAGQFLNPAPALDKQMSFNYIGTPPTPGTPGSGDLIRGPEAFGKWSWIASNKLNFVKWDPSVPDTRKITTQYTLTGTHGFEAASSDLDCIVTEVGTTQLNTFAVHPSTGVVTPVDNIRTVVVVDILTANIAAATKQVSNQCWAVRVNNFVYHRTAPTAAAGARYTKSVTGSTHAADSALFDPSYKFIFKTSTPAILQYKVPAAGGTADYETIIPAASLTGLKNFKDFKVSKDGTKIAIISMQAGTGTTFDYVAKLFAWSGTAWVQVPVALAASTVIGQPMFQISPDFQTFVVQSLASATAYTAVIKKITYGATNTVSAYTVPTALTTANKFPIVGLSNQYLYLYSAPITSPAGTINSQIYYKIDKANGRFVEFLTKQVPYNNMQAVFNGDTNAKLYEDASRLSFLVQVINANNVFIEKYQVGTPETQSALKNIQTAESGVVLVNGVPKLCPPGCLTCPNPAVCAACSNGFSLDTVNKYCVRCAPICKTCAFATPTVCTGCYEGYWVSGNTCARCSDSCRTCGTTASNCLSCKVGFRRTGSPGSYQCQACSLKYCNKCDADVAQCQRCKLGYVLLAGSPSQCVKCISGCTNCNPDKIFECLSCADGFEANTTNTGTVAVPVMVINSCTPCPDNCKTCALGTCTVCRGGFALINSKCVEPCRLPCKECVDGSPDQCTSCVGNYNLNGNSCNPDLTCNTASTCTFCPLGFNLIAGKCIQCNGGANCRTCENTNIQRCAVCTRGYYLTQNYACSVCSTGCAQCDDEVFCKRCKPGFTLSGTSQASQCIKCDSSCATCFESATNCKTCATGYTRLGWNCITDNHAQYNMRVDANLSDLTTPQLEAIVKAIATVVDKQESQVNVKQIRSGSIVIVGQIDTSSTTQQAAMISLLQAAYSSGSIAGFPILSGTFSSVVVDQNGNVIIVTNSSNEDEVTRMRNIAIIVGVVIPICLIIIFIVIFMLYKKGVICANDGPTKVRDMTMDEINVNQKDSEFNTMRKK